MRSGSGCEAIAIDCGELLIENFAGDNQNYLDRLRQNHITDLASDIRDGHKVWIMMVDVDFISSLRAHSIRYVSLVVNTIAVVVVFFGWRVTKPFSVCSSTSVDYSRNPILVCGKPEQIYPGSPFGYAYILGGLCLLAGSVYLSRRLLFSTVLDEVAVYRDRIAALSNNGASATNTRTKY